MDYSLFKKYAEQFILEKHKTLDVLKVHNQTIEDEFRNHMMNMMMNDEKPIGLDVKKVMTTCKNFSTAFINEHRN